MDDKSWNQWADDFANVFGLADEKGVTMIQSWRPIFEKAGYTEEDLIFAIDECSKNPPRFRNEHLAAIHNAVREKRHYDSPPEPLHDQPITCPFCGDSGYAIVPHPVDLKNGIWQRPYRTCAVLCACHLGERKRSKIVAAAKYPVPMGLDKYESFNPHWARQIKENEERQIRELRELNPGANPALSEALDRLRKRMGK